MEKTLVILILVALSAIRLYFRIRFHALSGIKAFQYEPVGILLGRYVLGAATFAGCVRYLVGGRGAATKMGRDFGAIDVFGAVLAAVGLALLLWSHLALDGNFSITIDADKDHRLITDGPYARIRHPIYISYLMIFGGLLALTGDLLFCGSGILVILSLMFLRAPYEERALRERFGRDFEEYRSRVNAFLPGMRPSPEKAPAPMSVRSPGAGGASGE